MMSYKLYLLSFVLSNPIIVKEYERKQMVLSLLPSFRAAVLAVLPEAR